MIKKAILSLFFSLILFNFSNAATIKIIAAENFYGELAHEIGGDKVTVQSILNNPNADPHLFTTSPNIIRSLNGAQIIIYNGLNYDPWMNQILQSLTNKNVIIINVADLMHINNPNPHIWYIPDTFPTLSQVLADKIIALDPSSKSLVKDNLNTFLANHQKVMDKISQIKTAYTKTPVIATEPVFGYMVSAMGLNMLGLDVQWKIMNDTEPSPKMLAQYENLITKRQVKILFYNNQVTTPITNNILAMAKENHIAIIGVSETMPEGTTINQWLMNEVLKTYDALKDSK